MRRLNENFEDFFRDHGPSLLRTAVLFSGGDRHAGEDLLQDALERCLRKWPTSSIEFPAAYVRTTMARLAQRRRVTRILTPSSPIEPPSERDETAQVEHRDVLIPALRQLPPRQRVAVVLRHWEDLSEAETANALGCSVGTVKSQTSRGLHALRRTLGPSFPDRSTTAPVPLIPAGEPS